MGVSLAYWYCLNKCTCSIGPDPWLPAVSAAGSSAGISFTHGPILGFFCPAGPLLTAKFDLDRFRGGGLRPQN